MLGSQFSPGITPQASGARTVPTPNMPQQKKAVETQLNNITIIQKTSKSINKTRIKEEEEEKKASKPVHTSNKNVVNQNTPSLLNTKNNLLENPAFPNT